MILFTYGVENIKSAADKKGDLDRKRDVEKQMWRVNEP